MKYILISLISLLSLSAIAGPTDDNHVHVEQVGSGDDFTLNDYKSYITSNESKRYENNLIYEFITMINKYSVNDLNISNNHGDTESISMELNTIISSILLRNQIVQK